MKGKMLEILYLVLRLKEKNIETMFSFYSNSGFFSLNIFLNDSHVRFFEGIDNEDKLNEITDYLLDLLLEDKE